MTSKKTMEEQIAHIHEFCIRLEPTIEDVKSLKKWRDGNGRPGARTQLYILWAGFILVGGMTLKVLVG